VGDRMQMFLSHTTCFSLECSHIFLKYIPPTIINVYVEDIDGTSLYIDDILMETSSKALMLLI
jgi:hypothetical protein